MQIAQLPASFKVFDFFYGSVSELASPLPRRCCDANLKLTPLAFVRKLPCTADQLTNKLAFGWDRGTFGGGRYERETQTSNFDWLDRHPAVIGSGSNSGPPAHGGQRPGGLIRQVSDSARRFSSQLMAMDAIWNSFFCACALALNEAVEAGWVAREDVEDSEPYLFLGVPGLVLFNALERSLGSEGVILMGDAKTEVRTLRRN
mmetsp:Transcript_43222/g.97687  ORF Transcript_43222/g.97687 Transcript_43222/m.97687 type:complete len:203 (+) Transcript_43222:481-1089(+)